MQHHHQFGHQQQGPELGKKTTGFYYLAEFSGHYFPYFHYHSLFSGIKPKAKKEEEDMSMEKKDEDQKKDEAEDDEDLKPEKRTTEMMERVADTLQPFTFTEGTSEEDRVKLASFHLVKSAKS